MKKFVIITVLAIIIVGVISIKDIFDNNSSIYKQSGVLGAQVQATNGQLIDVREFSEYSEGHAIGAINVPLSEIIKGKYSTIDKTKPVYVYCKSGVRAASAKVILQRAGYANVTVIGGLDDWTEQGGKVCKTSKPDC